MPDNDESFIEAGIRFAFDSTDFLRGSAEAQDALESTLAEMINFRREANKTEQEINDAIPGIAAALGASTEEVKDALKDLKKTEQETAKETARIQREEARSALAEKKRALREEEQLARQQQREEMARLRERQQAMREIRDTALAAVGATSLIAGTRNVVGLVGQTAAEGVAVSNMAARTGFSAREILAVGTAGALTPGSSRQEALQSMNALSQARTEYRLNGHSQLTDLLSSRYGVDISHIMQGSYETAMQRIVADLRRHGMSEGTFEEQLQFIQHELTHKEKSAGGHLKAARSAGEAGAIASYEYARPGQTEQDKRRQVVNTAQAAERIRRDHAQMQMAAAVRGGNVQTDNSQKTTISLHANNVNVKANDPHQMVQKVAQLTQHMMLASSVDTGVM